MSDIYEIDLQPTSGSRFTFILHSVGDLPPFSLSWTVSSDDALATVEQLANGLGMTLQGE